MGRWGRNGGRNGTEGKIATGKNGEGRKKGRRRGRNNGGRRKGRRWMEEGRGGCVGREDKAMLEEKWREEEKKNWFNGKEGIVWSSGLAKRVHVHNG